MKEQKEKIDKGLKESGIKSWSYWSSLFKKDPANFTKSFWFNFRKLNRFLKPLGMELNVNNIKKYTTCQKRNKQ